MKWNHKAGLTIVFSGILVGCGLWGDAKSRDNAIARCDDASGDVRFHPADVSTWASLQKGSDLVGGDWIQTSKDASAKIQFLEGSQLQVEPESLVILESKSESAQQLVSLRSGKILGSGQSKPLVVQTQGGQKVRITPGSDQSQVRVGVADDKLEVTVLVGLASLEADGAEPVALEKGQVYAVEGSPKAPTIQTLRPPAPVGPTSGASVIRTETGSVQLKWSDEKTAKAYRIQVAEDDAFQKVLLDERVQKPQVDFTPVEPGSFFWRVSAETAGGTSTGFGKAQQFSVRRPIPNRLVSPPDGTRLRSKQLQTRVKFRWQKLEVPAVYEWVLGQTPELDDVVGRSRVGDVGTFQTDLSPGEFYWGVFAIRDGRRDPLFETPFRLTVRKGRGLGLPNKLEWK